LNVVVDASAVVDLLMDVERAVHLRERLRLLRLLHAPHLIDLEVLQAIRRLRLKGDIDDVRAGEAIADHLALPIKRYPHHVLLLRAWELRANFTAYDAMYVVLADSLRATLITSDLRLAKAAARFVPVEMH
jgi:predicted nucleic acid-binding protein